MVPSEREPPRRLLDRYGATLLATAAAAIDHGLREGEPLDVVAADYDEPLRPPMASFVTLEGHGLLRGCVGSAEAHRPLIEDVAANGFAAAFRDSRFPPLTFAERDGLAISLSLLSPAEPLHFVDDEDLVRQLRPGVDGLVLRCGRRRGLFLPQVWAVLADPWDFLAQLRHKAGIDPSDMAEMEASRFRAWSLSSAAAPDGEGPHQS